MGIRESLNENPSITVGATIGIIVIAIIWIIWYWFGGSGPSANAGKAFFTDDDGQTWFADDANKIAPFDHNGKQADQCMVYKCGNNGKPFVAYILRYTDEGKKLRQTAMDSKKADPVAMEDAQNQMEVKAGPNQPKKPQGWYKMTDRQAAVIEQIGCPDAVSVDPNS